MIGICPRCGGSIYYSKKTKSYYCDGIVDDGHCKFSIWENNKLFATLGKKITKTMVIDWLETGQTLVKGIVSKKTNKPYDTIILLKGTGKYVNFEMTFLEKK